MAKKKKVDTTEAGALTHNPFAALAAVAGSPVTPLAAADPVDAPEAPDEEPPSGAPFGPKLVVRREKKGRGGKTITRVSGVRPAAREEVAGRMKRALGCGAALEGDDLILLGDVEERAAAWLEAEGARRVVRGS